VRIIVQPLLILTLATASWAAPPKKDRVQYRECVHLLKGGDGLWVRNPQRGYGTKKTVHLLRKASNAVRAKFAKTTDITIGDLSYRGGGKMSPHLSHRRGLDADVGYYYKDGRFRRWFAKTAPYQLDLARQWTFIDTLLKTGQVQYIFMAYRLQKALYRHAKKKGVPKRRLKRIFQWPRRWTERRGIIRFERGHGTHMHIRFKSDGAPEKTAGNTGH
jgi:murein endopeptidase